MPRAPAASRPSPGADAATPRAPRAAPTRTGRRGRGAADSPERSPTPGSQALTVEGAARLRAELDKLTTVKRREVVARIRTAKEHGDLKENSEYHAAREEQSFLEGRSRPWRRGCGRGHRRRAGERRAGRARLEA